MTLAEALAAQKTARRNKIIKSVLKTGKLHKDFIPLVLNRLKNIIQDKIKQRN